MWIYFRDCIPEPPPLTTGGEIIERVSSFKLLGVWHQNNMRWNTHIEKMDCPPIVSRTDRRK